MSLVSALIEGGQRITIRAKKSHVVRLRVLPIAINVIRAKRNLARVRIPLGPAAQRALLPVSLNYPRTNERGNDTMGNPSF